MRKLILSLIVFFTINGVSIAGNVYYLKKGTFYTRDEISLEHFLEASVDKNEENMIALLQMDLVKLNKENRKIELIDTINPDKTLIETPVPIVIFKFIDDYRKYYSVQFATESTFE